MNAAILLMGSAWMAGADGAPPAGPAQHAPPAVVNTGAGCGGGCGPSCHVDYCDTCGKSGLFSRMKGRWGKKCHDDCYTPCCPPPCHPCPPPCPPPCHPCPPPCHDTCCDHGKQGLFSRMKGRWGKKCHDDCCPTPCCGTAGYGGAPGIAPVGPVPPTGGDLPKEMPKGPPITPKQGSFIVPPTPVTPASGPRLSGSYSPY